MVWKKGGNDKRSGIGVDEVSLNNNARPELFGLRALGRLKVNPVNIKLAEIAHESNPSNSVLSHVCNSS